MICTKCGKNFVKSRFNEWNSSDWEDWSIKTWDFPSIIYICSDCLVDYRVNFVELVVKYLHDDNREMASTVILKWAKGELG